MYEKTPLQTLDFQRSMLVDVAAELIEEAAMEEAAQVVAAVWATQEETAE